MTTSEKMDWTRKHWGKLKNSGKLNLAIKKIKDQDNEESLIYWSVDDIIDIEESLPEYLIY